MIIQLEGNEAVFKTTIAEKLNKATGFQVIKGSSFELSKCTNDELYFYFKNLMAMDDIIIDRTIYSNLVYATLYDDYSILNEKQVEELEKMMKKKNVKTVYLIASSETIKARLRERGDEYVKEDEIDGIQDKYDEVMSNAKAPITWYDTEEFSSDEIVKELLKYYK